MRIGRVAAVAVGMVAVAAAPMVALAPRPVRTSPDGVRTIDDAVAACRATGLEGWELVEHAQHLVFRKFARYSILNVWETPATAFRNGRGYCNQYNSALATILERLGFQTERVFATRVRLDDNPWWRMGHSWVRVTIDGRTLDVCASLADNRPGHVKFIPVSEVLPFRSFTYWNTNNGMIAFTAFEAWKSIVTRQPLPRWVYRPFGERVREID
ncbi:hypothetical protein GCM10027418_24090 [Mariniluteicoccus endophyticus]